MKRSTKITNQSIESAGLPKDPKHAIAEYFWNGFDAKATQIELSIIKTDLIRTYLGFIDLLLQSEKSTEILPIIEQAFPLTDKEKNRIKQLITRAVNDENTSSEQKK
ncbi:MULTISPECIES: hypothetical protein [Sphingobacterium]|uniref:hypothetical protein n=1 Tax=Sphingobacterium TaxID=28453 RepID=UPI002579A993|nr:MULTISPECIES: hypothetical protein [Sphingobacterium]